MTMTAKLLSPLSAENLSLTKASPVSTPFTSGRDYVGGRADTGTTSRVKLWAAPTFDSDWPCLPKELQFHLQQAGELSFQRNAQKRLSLWTKRLHPYIKGEACLTLGFENASLQPKPGRKCWALYSFFPKPIDIRSTLYHDKGNRIVNGVCLILLNRWQILVNAYVHNYAWVLSTVWLNRSNNILVRCLVLSSV